MPHGKSLVKMEKMKISTKSVMWGSERLQEEDRVDAERRLSSWKEGTRGIPEESILEPILFKNLINNLGIKEWSMLMKCADGQKQEAASIRGRMGISCRRDCTAFRTRIIKIAQNVGVQVHPPLLTEPYAH